MRGSRTFTTFMNIEPGAGNERALSRFEEQANQSLRRVAATAQKAGALTSGMVPGTGSPGQIQNVAAAERARATALQRTARAAREADAATRRGASGMERTSNAARAAARETSRLERSLRLASVAANVAQGPLGPIAGRLSAMAVAVRELTGLRLGFVGVGAAVGGFVRLASTTQDLVARLRPLYETQSQVNAAFKDAQGIADRARVGLEPVIDLYARLTLAGKDVGLTQGRISRLTELASKAAKLSGGTAVSQEAGLYQFAQGIGSNTLQGDELRSVRENTLRLAKAIADGLGVPIGELKRLGKEGKLTAVVIEEALAKSAEQIEAEYERLPVTISSAFTALNNAFTGLVKDTDEATGVAGAFANVVVLVADNLGLVVKALGAAALAYAGFKTGSIIADTQARISAFQQERRALLDKAREAKATATADRQASAQRIVALRQERAALQQQIAAEQQLANEKRRNALSINSRLTRGPGFIAGEAADVAAYRSAMDEARVAQDNLAASKNRLRTVSGALRSETVVLTGATGRFRAASIAATSAAVWFGRSLRALLAAINPLGLALALAIPLLVEFAFRQDMAAGSADRMAEAQVRLARFIDQATGKILSQNAALIQNEILTAKKGAAEAREARLEKKRNFSFGGDRLFTVYRPDEIDPRLKRIRDQVRSGELGATRAAAQLGRLTDLTGQNAEFRDRLIAQTGEIVTLAQEELQATAAAKLLAGSKDPEIRRQAFGNFTGEDVDFGANYKPPEDGGTDRKVAGARRERAEATDEAAKAERDLAQAERRTDRRADIIGRYEAESSALAKAAADMRRLQRLVGTELVVRNDDGETMTDDKGVAIKRLYTQEMADADKEAIEYGVRKPIREAITEQERGLEISKLRLEGYTAEAEALEIALSLQDQIGEVTEDELADLLVNIERQREINDLLESRERQVSQILSLAQQTRDSFEDMLVGLRTDPIDSIKKFGNSILDNITRIEARRITEKLFAGADEKLRQLVSGSDGVERASEILAANVKSAADSVDPLIAANDNLATATELAAQRITDAANGIASGGSVSGLGGSSSLDRANQAATAANQAVAGVSDVVQAVTGGAGGGLVATVQNAARAAAGVSAVAGAITGGGVANAEDVPADNVIVVTGQRDRAPKEGPVPSGTSAYNAVFEKLGESLDKTFKSGTFFSGIGKGVGKALGGAAEGQMASSVAGLLGIKQSSTGAAIGGAIGSFIPIPGGSIIGGLIGGTLGGLFSKTKKASSTIGFGADGAFAGAASGNSSSLRSNANALAGGVADRLNQIATALDATITGGSRLSIGQRKDKFVVDTTGRGRTKGSGVIKFDSEEAAAQYAFERMLKSVVLGGISAASQNIIRNGSKNIDVAIQKALAIESIPKRLLAKTDPVRFAVESLNEEFTKLISYMKEGGATAQQYADAARLYELERAEAIEQATQQATAALQAYLDEMKGGSSSPFNKRTVYENASAKLNEFRGDIEAGRQVDQNDLLTAARNFQDASSALFGSSQAFFSDFDDIFALLTRARDNVDVGGADGSTLPGNPFETDSQVAGILAALNGTTQNQTDVLAGRLDQLIALFGRQLPPGFGNGSSVGYLPGFGRAGMLNPRELNMY